MVQKKGKHSIQFFEVSQINIFLRLTVNKYDDIFPLHAEETSLH